MKLILHNSSVQPWGTPDMSPFCTKVESYLRLANVPYQKAPASMGKAPKGKVPYVSLDGKLIGDSQVIVDTLEAMSGSPLDAWLSDEQRAVGHCIRRMLEEGFYFIGMYGRWYDDNGFAVLRPQFSRILPKPLRFLIFLIRNRVKSTLRGQGTARHTPMEVWHFGKRDLHALSVLLGDKPYILGDRASTIDATVYAFMEAFFGFPHRTPLQEYALTLTNLVEYRVRLRAQLFADLPSLRA